MALLGVGSLIGLALLWPLLPAPPPTKGGVADPPPGAFVALVAGALLVLGTARTVLAGWRARAWPRAQGVVVEARALGGPYLYTLCRYAAGGAEHTLDAVQYGVPRFSRLREGEPVAIRYDPADPARAVVQPGGGPTAATALALGVVVLGLSAFSIAVP